MKNIILAFLLVLFMGAPRLSSAAVSPLGLGVVYPVQFPPSDFTIAGLRLNVLWGKTRDVYGLDFGVVGNTTTQEFIGLAVAGGFNATYGATTILGLQLAGLANLNEQKTTVFGVQAAGILNRNVAASSVIGLQLALVNLAAHTNIYGFQVGAYNRANSVYGIQVGLVNVASNLHGIQIGLLNYNEKGIVSVSPFLNIGF